MRLALVLAALIGLCAGCGLFAATPAPPPSVDAARALLDDLVDAGIRRDFDRLCELAASGTCEDLLEGHEDTAPKERPTIVGTTVHPPQRLGDGGHLSGGVRFVLCGTDAAGEPYESEVYVSQNPDGSLFAITAVWWTGVGVIIGPGPADVGGEPTPGESGCS